MTTKIMNTGSSAMHKNSTGEMNSRCSTGVEGLDEILRVASLSIISTSSEATLELERLLLPYNFFWKVLA